VIRRRPVAPASVARSLAARLVLAASAFAVGAAAFAQDYPVRPVRFYCGFAPGGSSDIVSRLLAQKLQERTGQPFVVEQRIGAGGAIANQLVAKAPPDGHTMILLTGGHPTSAAMMKQLPYDPVKDFGMVSTIVVYPMLIAVSPSSPFRNLGELIAKAKAEPGKLTFGVSSRGSLHHLVSEWLALEAGADILAVSFKGASQAMIEVLGGRIDGMVETATASFPQIRAGKLRALAISSAERYPLMPDVPTIAETIPGVETGSWLGLAVSPGTPRPVVDKLNREIRAILAEPETQKRLAELGGSAAPSSPEQMAERIEREIARWNRVVAAKKIERE
jgi:tripartite-type tricarboxylate transporter receptor subunit TctC